MAIKVNVFLPEGEDLKKLKDSMVDFMVRTTIESHDPQEIDAVLKHYDILKKTYELEQ